jgi:DNA-binding HxlR family transcriptional regulator
MKTIATGQLSICPSVQDAFDVLGRKWTGLIVHLLSGGERHFCEMEKAVPALSARMLAARIKELEEEGIVLRTVHASSPVRVTYQLTEKGRDLIPVMAGIEEWARKWAD